MHPDLQAINVVGGYGASPVVHSRITSMFGKGTEYNKTVIITNRPQAAIVLGAAQYGLYTSVIGTRISRYAYGVETNRRWYEGCGFPESDAVWDPQKGELRIVDEFSILVKKGTRISPLQKFTKSGFTPVYKGQTFVSFPVYRSLEYCPKRTSDEGCDRLGHIDIDCADIDDEITVSFTFGTEILVEAVRDGKERTSETINCLDE